MGPNNKVLSRFKMLLPYRRLLTAAIFFIFALGVFTWTAKADIWTGAGQAIASQTRDWRILPNWSLNALPPVNDLNTFSYLGEGTIELNGQQSAGAMVFNDFTYTNIARGVLPLLSDLTMVNSLGGGPSFIQMGEGVRDTYGVDYFTAGPRFTADVNMNILNPINAALNVVLGAAGGSGSNSSMMFSGLINNLNNNSFNYGGTGAGTSLWISANNSFNGSLNNFITVGSAAPGIVGADGYALHLVDSGRMNFTPIALQGTASYLGLQDNTGGGAGGVQYPGNIYNNWVWSYGGNIFTDRSYQLPNQDSNTTVNVLQWLAGGVRDYNGMINFGSTSRFGRTNNGFSLRLSVFDWENNAIGMELVHVNNGNLTVGRGGSRYMSGANRLQEAHNYVFVDMLNEKSENQQNLIPLGKGGTGVLVVDRVNGGMQGMPQLWLSSPQVFAGVLSLGSVTNTPHLAPSVQLMTPDAGVGIGWNTPIDLTGFWGGGILPFPINPAAPVPGQSGAVDIDMWGYNAWILDPNFRQMNTYLRIGSSKGGDATFDPQPNIAKHASIMPGTQIIPYVNPMIPMTPIYYFGGGGGTLEVDTQINNYEAPNTMLEMGTTGTLLPGRVVLNPMQVNNTYTGPTEICAGTLQLMQQGSVWGSSMVHVWTYDSSITNGLYANPGACHHVWEPGGYTWTGPGQLLVNPNAGWNWNLGWYLANGGGQLINALSLDGGVVGWTGNVNLQNVPGTYGATITSNLNPAVNPNVNVLGLGGEYSAGTMFSQFIISNNPQTGAPVLLYKAGMNSILDLTLGPIVNTYTGGTIIAGGEIKVNNAGQLNAHQKVNLGGPIAILNGGSLHIVAGGANYNFRNRSRGVN